MFNLITSNNYQKSTADWMADSTCPYCDNGDNGDNGDKTGANG